MRIRLVLLIIILFFLIANCIEAQEDGSEDSKNIEPTQILKPEAENPSDTNTQPIEVNGDKLEFIPGTKECQAEGNVSVNYKGVRLFCDKLVLNTETKQGTAEGKVRLEDTQGVVEAERLTYNFETKTGLLLDSGFRANPYFGHAQQVEKPNELETIARYGYFTTCSYDKPHYKMQARKITLVTGQKLMVKDVTAFAGNIPVLYLPQYDHNFGDPLMHVQLSPGKRGDWGGYMLSAWRYQLTDNLTGRINFDYRNKLGLAEGIGTNYKTESIGRGDFKFYYTEENAKDVPEGARNDYTRYLLRLRHRWEITADTTLLAELYRIRDTKRANLGTDYNFLKDYFYREYEKDAQPKSYLSLHHELFNSSLDAILSPRVNNWYSEMTEQLPSITYNIPNLKLATTPFYLEHTSEFSSLKYSYPSQTSFLNNQPDDLRLNLFDIKNKFKFTSRVAFLQVTPFVSSWNTFFDKDVNNQNIWDTPRTVFSTGIDLSTKFYRIFNLKTNLLGLDLNGLRHIITPRINYTYQHKPTLANSRLKTLLAEEALTTNSATFEVSNKLQTKRQNSTVTVADLIVSNTYNFKTGDNNKQKGHLSDFLIKLDLLPYSWVRLYTEATYSCEEKNFTSVNPDISFSFGNERSLSLGQRYQRKGSNDLTCSLNYRFNPKWKFSFYQRHEIGSGSTIKRGIKEQEYSIIRDLHCWVLELTYNRDRNHGDSIWLILRLKAFPAIEFNFDQSYHSPKPGSSSQ